MWRIVWLVWWTMCVPSVLWDTPFNLREPALKIYAIAPVIASYALPTDSTAMIALRVMLLINCMEAIAYC